MILSPPTDCYYMVHASGEAAEFVASTLSASTIFDIKEAVLISVDFTNDIQATVSLDATIELVKQQLGGLALIECEYVNPLFTPSSPEELDMVLDGDIRSDGVAFVGPDGNPFMLKMLDVSADNREIMRAKLSCKPFELPSYGEIMLDHANLKLN